MGQKDTGQTKLLEEKALVDFLYVDKERADSFISQIRNGTLRSVTKTNISSKTTSKTGKGNIGVASGQYTNTNKTENRAAEQYDPYHSQLLNLLNDLETQPLEKLPDEVIGRLVLIEAPIVIRNITTIKALLPLYLKNDSLLSQKVDDVKKKNLTMINEVLQQMSDSISLSIHFDNNLIIGTLKESGLAIKQDDLMRTYGVNIPGKWFVLGILDSSISTSPDTILNSLEGIVDILSVAVNNMYSSSKYKIVPVLIFRIINF